MPTQLMHDLCHLLAEPGALEQALVQPGLIRLLEQCHKDARFVVQGVDGCAESRTGSQAGDPLGDILSQCTSECKRTFEMICVRWG